LHVTTNDSRFGNAFSKDLMTLVIPHPRKNALEKKIIREATRGGREFKYSTKDDNMEFIGSQHEKSAAILIEGATLSGLNITIQN